MIRIYNNDLSGEIDAIESKSFAHRQIICASLSEYEYDIKIKNISEDILMTISCLKELGADIRIFDDYINIKPIRYREGKKVIDCGESGSTLRFLIPIATSIYDDVTFTGKGRLPKRPIIDLLDVLSKNGCILEGKSLPLNVVGRLNFSNVKISGEISSQYISALLMASVLQKNDVKIEVDGNIESKPYIDITKQVMEDFSVKVIEDKNFYYVNNNQKYITKNEIIVEKDWSNSAFFLVAGALNKSKSICIKGLNINTSQGDSKIIDIFRMMGVDFVIKNDGIIVKPSKIQPAVIDVSQIPDLAPVLSVLASKSNGRTILKNIQRLKLKESNRIDSTIHLINALGGKAYQIDNTIVIDGNGKLKGGLVDSRNDHRIAMAASIASIICEDEVVLYGEDAVNKSYKTFFDDFSKLGGKYVFDSGK